MKEGHSLYGCCFPLEVRHHDNFQLHSCDEPLVKYFQILFRGVVSKFKRFVGVGGRGVHCFIDVSTDNVQHIITVD
jgi:hypothetical protein